MNGSINKKGHQNQIDFIIKCCEAGESKENGLDLQTHSLSTKSVYL